MILKTYFDYDYSGGQNDGGTTATKASSGINSTLLLCLIIAILSVAVITLVLTIINMVNINKMKKKLGNIGVKVGNMENTSKEGSIGVVFCKKCGSQFKATESSCPFCGNKK